MKRTLSFLLVFGLTLCLFSCKNDVSEEKSPLDLYTEAVDLAKGLSYQKFDISRQVTLVSDGSDYTEPYSIFCKLIRENGKLAFYSERTLKVETEAGVATPILYHHYQNGVMYQTLESSKTKHTLSAEDFEKQYLGLHSIVLSVPSGDGVSCTKISDNKDGGSDFSLSLDTSLLEKSELDKLYAIFENYSSHGLDSGYAVVGAVNISFSTDFDGYFVRYSLSYNVSGEEAGNAVELKMELSLDIFNPGSHFVMNELSSTSKYTEGTLNIK